MFFKFTPDNEQDVAIARLIAFYMKEREETIVVSDLATRLDHQDDSPWAGQKLVTCGDGKDIVLVAPTGEELHLS